MKLYINKQIVKDAQKEVLWLLTGVDGVSYSDINAFIESVPQDEQIDIELYSCGGDCAEGFAIYDALRTCGHTLTTTVIGECASMATILMLVAPKESRRAYKHARFLIHEPFYCDGVSGEITLERADQLKEMLESEKAKMVAVYVERTGASEEEILAQLADGKWFDAERAMELGFISEIVPETSASVVSEKISTTVLDKIEEPMAKKENEAKSLWQKLGELLGMSESESPVALVLYATDGTELTIEREEGDIQVGDKATPDGTFTLEDGRTITIQEGVITEIREAETPEESDTPDELAEVKAENERLRTLIEELQGKVKTESDVATLLAVEAMGGIERIKATPVAKVNIPTNERPQGSVETNVFKELLNKHNN